MKIDSVIKEFNKTHAAKAKLVSVLEKSIVIEVKGKSEQDIENDMYALRTRFEEALDESVLIQKITKSGNIFTIKFSIEKSPTEDILEILKRYEEGTSPHGPTYED